MKTYRVLPGNAFDLGAGKTAGPGERIELPDDVADQHRHRIELAPVEEPVPSVASAPAAAMKAKA